MKPSDQEASPAREMPRYKSHKTVHALKIKAVERYFNHAKSDEDIRLLVEDGFAPIDGCGEICLRYIPSPGDYYVVYDDGYKSVSPAKAFEDGYTRI